MPAGVDLAWASSNESVATVDGLGEVTAIDAGSCVITASFEYEGDTYSDTCDVEVIQPECMVRPTNATMDIEDTLQLSVNTVPEGRNVIWFSENDSIATVDSNGMVTAVAEGSCRVNAEFSIGSITYGGSCNITVNTEGEKVLGNFVLANVWNDESNWISKNYEEPSRQTYVHQYDNHLEMCFNPIGETSNLFLDIRPVKEIFGEIDTSRYDYALRFNIEGTVFIVPSETMTITVKGGGASDNVFKLNTFSELFEYGTDFNSTVELVPNNPDGTRLMTLQINVSGQILPTDYVTLSILNLELIRTPKP